MMVSIILPFYNADKYILETVDSIISQSFLDWELLIIDDCSTKRESLDILKLLPHRDNRIKVLYNKENCGAGMTRNIGIKNATGRYLAFCDSDDWWYPTKLEDQLAFMEINNYPFTCTWYEDANERLEPYYTMKQAPKQNYKNLIRGCNVGTPGVMIDTQVLGKKYMPNLRRAEDWGYWMIYLQETEYIYTVPKVLWKYRHVAGSETSNKWKQMAAVILMYQQVLGMSKVKARIVGTCLFLPRNIYKKLKKMF